MAASDAEKEAKRQKWLPSVAKKLASGALKNFTGLLERISAASKREAKLLCSASTTGSDTDGYCKVVSGLGYNSDKENESAGMCI